MKETINEFKVPEDVLTYLKKYNRFRVKKFVNTIENKFYVGTEVAFGGTKSFGDIGNGYNKTLDRIVLGDIQYIRFYKVGGSFGEEFITIVQSIDDLLNQVEPIIVKEEDFKFKFKLGKLEIILKR